MNKKTQAEILQGQLIDRCEQMSGHVKLLRDYALTPDNIWLARGELNRIGEVVGELEDLLDQIKHSE